MGNVLIDDKAPLISIVVPVYKVEMFLSRCIESVLHQTYTNWESDAPACLSFHGKGNGSGTSGVRGLPARRKE